MAQKIPLQLPSQTAALAPQLSRLQPWLVPCRRGLLRTCGIPHWQADWLPGEEPLSDASSFSAFLDCAANAGRCLAACCCLACCLAVLAAAEAAAVVVPREEPSLELTP